MTHRGSRGNCSCAGFIARHVSHSLISSFWLSLVYCAGHLCLALFESNRTGSYTGLCLIALGSGGIKPCVAAFDKAVEGVRAVLRVLVLFFLVTPFWSLFDQKASTWVLQADAMTKPSWFQSSQMAFWNLSVRVGNLWVLVVNSGVKHAAVTDFIESTGFGVTAFQMYFFAGFALVAALAFGPVAKRYRVVEYYRTVPV